jgi:hypothetical protein
LIIAYTTLARLSTVSLSKCGRETLLDWVLFSGKCTYTLLLFEPSFCFFFIFSHFARKMHM